MQTVSAYGMGNRLVLQPHCQTVDGVWVLQGECRVWREKSGRDSLGQVLDAALRDSKTAVRPPRSWSSVGAELLAETKKRSLVALAKSTPHVIVTRGADLRFTPLEYRGEDGSVEREDLTVVIDAGSDIGEVRQSLTEAMELARRLLKG